MKTIIIPAVSIVLVGILFCPIVMAAPPMPDGLQIVQPDSSLPKELSAFWGKWEGVGGYLQYFLIVEKIDEEKASVWFWRSRPTEGTGAGWQGYDAAVNEERGKYKIWFTYRFGKIELTLKGEYLDLSAMPYPSLKLRRVP